MRLRNLLMQTKQTLLAASCSGEARQTHFAPVSDARPPLSATRCSLTLTPRRAQVAPLQGLLRHPELHFTICKAKTKLT